MEAGTKNTEGKKTFYLIAIILLILLNGFFAYNHWAARKQVKLVEAQRNELDSLYTSVLAELNGNQLHLDTLEGLNETLDSMLLVRYKELEASKKEIEDLLKENKLTKSQYDDARKLIKSLKADNQKYITRIDSLSRRVHYLTLLSDSLSEGLQTQRAVNEQLKSERVILAQKVELGSLLKPENVVATGIRYKSNDREVLTNSAKKTEKLKLCFDVPANQVADAGGKTYLLRLLNPQGTTIAVSAQGSGVFEIAETGEQQQYTLQANFDYANKEKNVCVYWSQTAAYGSGMYKALFYQDGYLLKETEFELK